MQELAAEEKDSAEIPVALFGLVLQNHRKTGAIRLGHANSSRVRVRTKPFDF